MPTGSAVALMKAKKRGCELPKGCGEDPVAHRVEHRLERLALLGQRLVEDGRSVAHLAEDRPLQEPGPVIGHQVRRPVAQPAHRLGVEIEVVHAFRLETRTEPSVACRSRRQGVGSKGKGYRTIEFEGFVILVGKGDADNDRLTFGVAEPRDFWLHVAGPAGSHVSSATPSTSTSCRGRWPSARPSSRPGTRRPGEREARWRSISAAWPTFASRGASPPARSC